MMLRYNQIQLNHHDGDSMSNIAWGSIPSDKPYQQAFAYFDRLPLRWAAFLFFSIECLLLLGIGWVMGNSGTWLMGLPLAGTVVMTLPPARRWPVYAAMLVVLILPTALFYEGWAAALANSLNLGAAIFFVVIFVQMRLKEQAQREKAEHLIEDVAQQALKEMRLLIYELRPPALENEGLQGALLHLYLIQSDHSLPIDYVPVAAA